MLGPLAALLASQPHRDPVQAVSGPAAFLHHIEQAPWVDQPHPSALAFDPHAEAMADEVPQAPKVLTSHRREHDVNE